VTDRGVTLSYAEGTLLMGTELICFEQTPQKELSALQTKNVLEEKKKQNFEKKNWFILINSQNYTIKISQS
jgi:hypothetical protein